MNAKYTPGPWIQFGTSVRAADNEAIIASVQANYRDNHSTFGSIDEINHVEQVANANLIAAAPELLEALQLTVSEYCDDRIVDIVTGEFFGEEPEWILLARAAIAKATGESND